MPEVLATPEEILEAVSSIPGIYDNEPVDLIALAFLEANNFLDAHPPDLPEPE